MITEEQEIKQTQVDMDGLLEVLGKNLYSTDLVVIRELIQNAHDACVRRRLEDPSGSQAQLKIYTLQEQGALIFEDSGSGLTESEIVDYLATIGKGFTRILRAESSDKSLIGQFGLGFLTAYVVSSKVEVVTTSYQTPDQTWKFTSHGGKTFSVSQVATEPVGTRVSLYLKTEYQRLSDPELLHRYLIQCCRLLSMDILLNGHSCQDDVVIPWQVSEDTPTVRRNKLNLEFASIFETKLEPLFAFDIPGHDGVLWIQGASAYGASDFRNVSVFIRNMFITDECRDLLPEWATFVGCVIDTPLLTPTASREEVVKDEQFSVLKQHIEDTLKNGLLAIATDYPELWQSILKRHNQALLGAAVSDDALFDLLHEQLCLPSSVGDIRLSSLLRNTDTLYIKSEDKNNYQDVLFRAQKTPVINGYFFAAYSFSQKYCEWHHKRLVDIDRLTDHEKLFTPIQITSPEQQILIEHFSSDTEEVTLCKFEPVCIPIVICENKDRKLKQRIEDDEAGTRIGSAALALARIHTQRLDADTSHYIYINWNNPLMQKMSSLGREQRIQIAALLNAYMKTLCHDMNDDEIHFLSEMENFMSALEALV